MEILIFIFIGVFFFSFLTFKQKNDQSEEETPSTSNQKGFLSGVQIKLEDEAQEKNSSLVSSLAEKAMSVAGPVVPTKSDGEVDHERYLSCFIVFFLSGLECCWTYMHNKVQHVLQLPQLRQMKLSTVHFSQLNANVHH